MTLKWEYIFSCIICMIVPLIIKYIYNIYITNVYNIYIYTNCAYFICEVAFRSLVTVLRGQHLWWLSFHMLSIKSWSWINLLFSSLRLKYPLMRNLANFWKLFFFKNHFHIFSRKIRCQNIITSDLKFSFITSRWHNHFKHIIIYIFFISLISNSFIV